MNEGVLHVYLLWSATSMGAWTHLVFNHLENLQYKILYKRGDDNGFRLMTKEELK